VKKVLIICYSFPPNPGVGGRRWAKFAKCLAKNDYDIHVVLNHNKSSKISEWNKDVGDAHIIKHTQNVFYPSIFTEIPRTFLGKITYRFWLLFFKLFSKGSLYDKAFFWKKAILKDVKKIIVENEIKNVIVTGPPFRLLYFTALLKNELKDINLIIDLRDPWTDNTSFFGFNTISEKCMDFEKMMEKEVVSKANYVISVNDYLTEIFKKKYSLFQEKFITLHNGFDIDEVLLSSNVAEVKKEKIDFILIGSLYPELEYIFIPFLEYLKNNKNFSCLEKITFHFYGQVDYKLEQLIKSYALASIKFYGVQKIDYVKQKVVESDFCMMFTSPNHASNFNTKFYEYTSMRKPIVHFSNPGDISNVIISNNLGFAIRPDTFKQDFEKMLEAITLNEFKYNANYNLNEFEITHLTSKLETLFI
jgi:hypothetical protein